MSVLKSWYKDPSDVLDWAFDWSKWLQNGETLTDQVVTVDAGLTVDSVVLATDRVTVWLSGGTVDTKYVVACKVTTSQGRIAERSLRIVVEDR